MVNKTLTEKEELNQIRESCSDLVRALRKPIVDYVSSHTRSDPYVKTIMETMYCLIKDSLPEGINPIYDCLEKLVAERGGIAIRIVRGLLSSSKGCQSSDNEIFCPDIDFNFERFLSGNAYWKRYIIAYILKTGGSKEESDKDR